MHVLLSQNPDDLADPKTYEEALQSSNREEWDKAVQEELAKMAANNVWEIQKLPPGKKAVGCTWVFKTKKNQDGIVIRFKARLCAQGFSQVAKQDFNETFAPVARIATVRSLLASAAHNNDALRQLDVVTAFLNGELDEEIYMRPPKGMAHPGPGKALRLNRSIYGLKQAARVWYKLLSRVLQTLGLNPSPSDPCLFVTAQQPGIAMAVVVDDFIIKYQQNQLQLSIKSCKD